MSVKRTVIVKDPHLPWDGPFPYDYLSERLTALGCAPVHPDTTSNVIKDVFFDLLNGASDRTVRAAWDELRQPQRRLVVDFFMYETPEVDIEGALADLREWKMPIEVPDFRRLADVSTHAGELVTEVTYSGPPTLAAPPRTRPVIVDIGPTKVDLLGLLEDGHE